MKKLIRKIRRSFKRKKIVYSTMYKPGRYLYEFYIGRQLFVRVVWDHRMGANNTAPITEIPARQITGVKTLYSKGEIKLCSLIGIKLDNKKRKIKPFK